MLIAAILSHTNLVRTAQFYLYNILSTSSSSKWSLYSRFLSKYFYSPQIAEQDPTMSSSSRELRASNVIAPSD